MDEIVDSATMSSGDVLRAIRAELGLKQDELAERLDYHRSVVSNAEAGREISAAYLQRFGEHFPEVKPRLAGVRPTAARPRVSERQEPLGAVALSDMFFRRSDRTTELDGEWFALWETTAEHHEVLNSEKIIFKMKRDGSLLIQNIAISDENPEGGYLWIAQGRVFDNQYILGTYIPREPNVRSKGCLYLVIHPSGRFITGQWVGCNYDGDWARGLVVISRAEDRLHELMDSHRQQLPSIPYNMGVTN